MHHFRDGTRIQLPRIIVADGADRILAADFQLLQHAEEFVRIGHAAPMVAQLVAADVAIGCAIVIAGTVFDKFL